MCFVHAFRAVLVPHSAAESIGLLVGAPVDSRLSQYSSIICKTDIHSQPTEKIKVCLGYSSSHCRVASSQSWYREAHFKEVENLKNPYKIQFWSYEKNFPDLKRSRRAGFRKNNLKIAERVYDS